jgi:hypothetical protein
MLTWVASSPSRRPSDGGDPALERNRLAGQAVRVASAVAALVVGERDRRRQLEQGRRGAGQDRVPDLGVPLDDRPLFRGQRSRLQHHAVGDADLADVVEAAGDADQLAVLLVEADPPRELRAIAAHPLGVPARLDVAELDRRREAPDHLLARDLQFRFGPAQLRDRLVQLLLGTGAVGKLVLESRVDAGVVQCERGEATEALEHLQLGLPECGRVVRVREPQHPDDLGAGPQRHADDRADLEVVEVPRAIRPRPVAGDDQRLPGRQHAAGQSLPALEPVAVRGGEDPGRAPRAERLPGLLDQVEVAVRRPEQPARPVDDRLEQRGRVETLDQADRSLVQGLELGVPAAQLFHDRVRLCGGGGRRRVRQRHN